MWGGTRGGVLARRGLSAGASCTFSLAELAAAVDHPPADYVYAEPDAAGALWSRAGGAALAVRARLAPAGAARNAALGAARRGRLRLRLTAAVPPLQELLLWPDADALAALHVPALTPLDISGSKSYRCRRCGTEFEYPNPLKIHLFMECQEYAHVDFWRRCLAGFREAAAESAADARGATSWPPAPPAASALAPPALSPAALEALAAAWGRSRDGHVCVYCGKLYSRKYGLKIHIRTHTGYKPLRCRHCLRAFGDPSNLNKHVRLHARGAPGAGATRGPHGRHAPHACALCGAALARRRDLERHMRSRHASASDSAPL